MRPRRSGIAIVVYHMDIIDFFCEVPNSEIGEHSLRLWKLDGVF